MKTIIPLILISLISGCNTTHDISIDFDLFPVKGPLSSAIPLRVIKATATNVSSYSGKCFLTLYNGEYCEGRWSSTGSAGSSINNYSLLLNYGQELGLSPRGNENRGYAILVGDRGTSIEIEFLTGIGTGHGLGVAKDNKGNIFKVLF